MINQHIDYDMTQMFKTYQLIIFLMLIPILSAAQGHESWSYNLNIYQVNTRQYTATGTFNDFSSHLDRLSEMGVGIIYFMPIHPIGEQNRLGSLGSPYSVKDYLAINPEFGTMEDFTRLVDSIHAKGMYAMLDWVPNHTAWDNPLTVQHPEWYVTDDQGNFTAPPGTNWSDVIQLDYEQTGLREYMIDAMAYWVQEADIDGFRVDAASFVPLDFWSTAIPQLKAIKPELLLLAEDDGTQYKSNGFDMTYAWGLHGFGSGLLKRILSGASDASALEMYMITEWYFYYPDHYRMYFTSNHDDNAWYGTAFEQFGAATETFAVLTATMNSMQLIYGGQEAGLDHRLAFFDKDLINWRDHPFYDIYQTLWHLKKENQALWNGGAGSSLVRVQTDKSADCFAFLREKEEDRVFAIFNLSAAPLTITVSDSNHYGIYRNVFLADTTAFTQDVEMTLSPWGYQVFEQILPETGVDKEDELLQGFLLYQNFPNPFNSHTTVSYDLGEGQPVRLTIFDLSGRQVRTLIRGNQVAGHYELSWDGTDQEGNPVSAGVYLTRLQVGDQSRTIKMVYLK